MRVFTTAGLTSHVLPLAGQVWVHEPGGSVPNSNLVPDFELRSHKLSSLTCHPLSCLFRLAWIIVSSLNTPGIFSCASFPLKARSVFCAQWVSGQADSLMGQNWIRAAGSQQVRKPAKPLPARRFHILSSFRECQTQRVWFVSATFYTWWISCCKMVGYLNIVGRLTIPRWANCFDFVCFIRWKKVSPSSAGGNANWCSGFGKHLIVL